MSVVLVANAVLIGGVTESVAASDNKAPLADAGLDQSVTVNTTVYLDASGSRDPDGEVVEYEWRIEQPDGNYTTPECGSCGRTSLVARESGTYNATVTVTDDQGATNSDTLRVHVSPSDGPTVTLSGPDDVVEGDAPTFSAIVDAGESELMAVTWRVDDRRVNRTEVSGDSATVDQLHAFRTDGEYTVRVTVTDRLGRQDAVTKNVTVREPSSPGGDDGGGGGGAAAASTDEGDSDGEACARYGRDDDRYCNNDRMTMDSNGITISDADNDGTTEWGGVTLDEEFAERHEEVSYDSTDGVVEFETQEAYKESLGLNTVHVEPTADVNERNGTKNSTNGGSGDVRENENNGGDSDTSGIFGGYDGVSSNDAGSGDDNTESNENDETEEGGTESQDTTNNGSGWARHGTSTQIGQ